MKTKLFTISEKDLEWTTCRSGGAGGQNVNKRDTAARVTHAPSGVTCEAREQRSQLQNRREALRKLASHPKFLLWCRLQAAANREGYESVATKVEEAMDERNLRIETAPDCVPGEAHCDVKKG